MSRYHATVLVALLSTAVLACKGSSTTDQGSSSPPKQAADGSVGQPAVPDAHTSKAVPPAEISEFGAMLDVLLAEPSPATRSRKACAVAEELSRKARATRKAPPPSPAVADEWSTIVSDVLEGKSESLEMDCRDDPDAQAAYLDQLKDGIDRLIVLAGDAAPR